MMFRPVIFSIIALLATAATAALLVSIDPAISASSHGYSTVALDSLDLLPALPDTAPSPHYALNSDSRYKLQPTVGTERELYPESVRLAVMRAPVPMCPPRCPKPLQF